MSQWCHSWMSEESWQLSVLASLPSFLEPWVSIPALAPLSSCWHLVSESWKSIITGILCSFLQQAYGATGITLAGFLVNILDVSRNHTAILSGACNTLGNFLGGQVSLKCSQRDDLGVILLSFWKGSTHHSSHHWPRTKFATELAIGDAADSWNSIGLNFALPSDGRYKICGWRWQRGIIF